MRKTRNVRLACVILTVSDDLTLHAHARVMRIQVPTRSPARRLAERAAALPATHLEERVHLLLGAHLVTENATAIRCTWVVQV